MKINIQVIYDSTGKTISITPEAAAFNPGDVVVWEFRGLQDGEIPEVKFLGPPPLGTGPFTSLRWTGSCIVASGSFTHRLLTLPAEFFYTAIVRSPDGTEVAQAQGTLERDVRIDPTFRNSNLDILVQVDPDDPGQLMFTPDADLQIIAGDTLTWHLYLDFEPKDVHIRFRNLRTGVEDPFGPFQSVRVKRFHPGGLDWTAAGNTETDLKLRCTLQASGANAVPERYSYTFYTEKPDLRRLWLRRRHAEFTGDPMVDNLGPPIGG